MVIHFYIKYSTVPGEFIRLRLYDKRMMEELTIDMQFLNPEPGYVVESVDKFFQGQISEDLAKIPESEPELEIEEDHIDIRGKRERIEDARTEAYENVYNPSTMPLYLGFFSIEDPSTEVREYVLRGLVLTSIDTSS
ncbi:MAG: hypothetical protein EOO01_35760 [Chitinophagaceae bacterium]|nr:MAG: hypothetical protein EOO01_35760 [Chitinophagaceae bacterium]